MAMFNSYVKLPEGNQWQTKHLIEIVDIAWNRWSNSVVFVFLGRFCLDMDKTPGGQTEENHKVSLKIT